MLPQLSSPVFGLKRVFRRVLQLLCVLSLVVSLTACGGSQPPRALLNEALALQIQRLEHRCGHLLSSQEPRCSHGWRTRALPSNDIVLLLLTVSEWNARLSLSRPPADILCCLRLSALPQQPDERVIVRRIEAA